MIKDSGDRTQFNTGAVRDMHTGKGRMDLLPWEALVEVSKHCEEGALKYGERNCEKGIPIHMEASVVLSDVGDDMHRLGFTWAEIEDMELEAIA